MPTDFGGKWENGSVLIGSDYLNTRFPGSFCLPYYCRIQREVTKKEQTKLYLHKNLSYLGIWVNQKTNDRNVAPRHSDQSARAEVEKFIPILCSVALGVAKFNLNEIDDSLCFVLR